DHCVKDDPRLGLDTFQDPLGLPRRADHPPQMLVHGDILALHEAGPRDRADRLAGRIRHQMQMEAFHAAPVPSSSGTGENFPESVENPFLPQTAAFLYAFSGHWSGESFTSGKPALPPVNPRNNPWKANSIPMTHDFLFCLSG